MKNIQYIIFCFYLLFMVACSSPGKKETNEKEVFVERPERARGAVTMIFNFGVKDRIFQEVPWREGQSVYDIIMQLNADIASFNVTDSLYGDLGHLIMEIDAVKNASPNYWVYCVNGQKANKGVDDFKLKDGDQVNWFYTSDTTPCEQDENI